MAEPIQKVPSFHKRRNTIETCFFVEEGEEMPSVVCFDRPIVADPPSRSRHPDARFSAPSAPSAPLTPAMQILQALVKRSTKAALGAAPKQPALHKPVVSETQRARFIDRFIELLNTFGHSEATLFRAVHIVDRFAASASRPLDKNTFQLSSLVALRLAAKLEETRPMKLNAFLENSVKNKFPKAELVRWELAVLAASDFALSAPTEIDLLFAALDALDLQQEEQLKEAALRLVRLSLFCLDTRSEFRTAEITAFALIYALRTIPVRDGRSFDAVVQQVILAFSLDSDDLVTKLGRFFAAVGSFGEKYSFLRNVSTAALISKKAN